MPDKIMEENFNDEEVRYLADQIALYKKSGREWDEFRRKVRTDILEKFAKVLSECRRSGFYAPYASYSDGKPVIKWHQMVIFADKEQYNLCNLCERPCHWKDEYGVFIRDNDGNEVKRCWQRGNKKQIDFDI